MKTTFPFVLLFLSFFVVFSSCKKDTPTAPIVDAYTVTYNGNQSTGGSVPTDSNTYKTGDEVTVLEQGSLVRTGYNFAGWNENPDGNGDNYTAGDKFAMGNANVTLYAKWTSLPTFTVSFNSNEGSSVPDQIVIQNEKVTEPAPPTRTGYSFDGWYKESGLVNLWDFAVDVVTVNITVYAKWAPSGSLDTSFDPGTGANDSVKTLIVQSNGKILIGGQFSSYNGIGRNKIVRLNSDGSLDTGFDPGTGANNNVNELAVLADGKILITGDFTSYNGTLRNYIARLNSNGSLDTGFDPGTGANDNVFALAVQADGKILIGAYFTIYNGTGRNHIARLNSNGSLDTSFDPGIGANYGLQTLAIQSNGKILIGGGFTSYNGTGRNYIARLNSDGSLDTSFDPGAGADSTVQTLAVQADGKILIGGWFTSYNGIGRNRIARLNSDGSLDTSFAPGTGADNAVYSLALQANGKFLIGGWFNSYKGTDRSRIARIYH